MVEHNLAKVGVAGSNPVSRSVMIREIGSPVSLFYSGGCKSLPCALTCQADDRTLTGGEVAKVRGPIVKRLNKELGAELRGEGFRTG